MSTEPRHQRVAALVRAVLAARQIQKKDAAAAIGMPQQTFSRKVTGYTPFTLDELDDVAEYLGITVADIFNATEGPELPPGVAREVAQLRREAGASE